MVDPDSGARVDEVVLVDQDVGVGDQEAERVGVDRPQGRVADERRGDREAGDLGLEDEVRSSGW